MLRTNSTMTMVAMPHGGLRRTLAVALVAAGAAFGALAQAPAQPSGPDGGPPGRGMRMDRGMGMQPGMEGMGGMHPGMMGGPGMFMGRRLDRMLDGVAASDAQRAQIRQIAQTAAADLMAQRAAGRGLRAQGLQIFAAPNVDAAAAESLRQQMLAQHDQASRRMLQAMLDVANVLTPEQRMKLAESARQHSEQMRNRMRERAPRTPPGNS